MPRPATNARLISALEFARASIWDTVVPDNRIIDSKIYWRDHGMALLGMPPARKIQSFRHFLACLHPQDGDRVLDEMQQAVDRHTRYDVEYRVIWPDGSHHWLNARAEIIFPGTGQSARTLGLVSDITARKKAELALAAQKELAEVTLGSIGEGVITTDARGTVRWMNRVAENVTGWSAAEVAGGVAVTRLFKVVDEETEKLVDNVAMTALRLNQTVSLLPHGSLVNKNGKRVPIEDSASPIRATDGTVLGAVIVFRDVSHERAMKQELSWHAAHDPLTGLINRRVFENHAVSALASAKNENHQHALMILDLDRFKVVNDTCGHVAGDVLLKILTKLLHGHMREADILARLGGDEFGALLLRCRLDQALLLSDKLRIAVKEFRFVWEGHTFEVGVSIGLVMINQNSKSVSELLSAADQACYAAKELGRNRVHVYQETDQTVARRHSETLWIPRLSEALEQKRFVLYTQPIVSLSGGQRTHREVLLRMIGPDGELIYPNAFIAAAERYNVMIPIDRWVIETVCGWMQRNMLQAAQETDDIQQEDTLYSINLAGASLNDGTMAAFITRIVDEYGVDPARLCFEVTETTAISNLDAASTLMHGIKRLGCKFALDDFGSGFSSFAYLKILPVDYLKIDGMFVRDITANKVNQALVTAINEVGHVMGMKTIAEYVETPATLEMVRQLGIDYAQGHAVGMTRPLLATPAAPA